ncbi:MAG TPA: hypothetical protein VL403_14115 [Candidatus Kryptonia bacterium]|nr:hypothetical protein [Candidatus Kryptonia bacterium]
MLSAQRSALFAAVLLLAGCRGTDPRREDAQWLLEAATRKQAAATCVLEDFLVAKPEFAAIRAAHFCDARVSVTRIREVSNDERVVEYDLIRSWQPTAVEQWIDAARKLEARLLALQPQRSLEKPAVGPPQTRFVWTDPTDGQVFTKSIDGDFVASTETPPGITATDEWQLIRKSRDFTLGVASRGSDTAEPLEAVLRRVGSGWEVSVPARKRSDSTA